MRKLLLLCIIAVGLISCTKEDEFAQPETSFKENIGWRYIGGNSNFKPTHLLIIDNRINLYKTNQKDYSTSNYCFTRSTYNFSVSGERLTIGTIFTGKYLRQGDKLKIYDSEGGYSEYDDIQRMIDSDINVCN